MAGMPGSVIEPSQEFINTIFEYIKAHGPLSVSKVIDAAINKFPKTFTRNDVKHFTIKTLRVLVETGKINVAPVSLDNTETTLVFPTRTG